MGAFYTNVANRVNLALNRLLQTKTVRELSLLARVTVLALISQLGFHEDRMERLKAVQWNLNRRDFRVILAILVFDDNPEKAGDVIDFFWVVQQQLLVEIWVLVVLDHD